MKFSLELNVTTYIKGSASDRLTAYRTSSRTWAKPRLVKSRRLITPSTYQSFKQLEFATLPHKFGIQLALSSRTLLTLSNKTTLTRAEMEELHKWTAILFLINGLSTLLRNTLRVQLSLLHLNSYCSPLGQLLLRNVTVRKFQPERSVKFLATHLSLKL